MPPDDLGHASQAYPRSNICFGAQAKRRSGIWRGAFDLQVNVAVGLTSLAQNFAAYVERAEKVLVFSQTQVIESDALWLSSTCCMAA